MWVNPFKICSFVFVNKQGNIKAQTDDMIKEKEKKKEKQRGLERTQCYNYIISNSCSNCILINMYSKLNRFRTLIFSKEILLLK